MSTDLQTVNREQELTKLENFQSAEQMMDFARILITSKLVPAAYNTPEKVVAAVLTGKELGFGPVTSLNNLHVIQGRATLSVHAIGALMRSKGIVTKTIQYFEPINGEDGKPKDYVTTIRFYQPFMGTVIEEDCSFSWQEATKMGLITKDPWVKMPKVMLYNRCLAIGCRRVAPDAMLGLYETAEAADFSGKKYEVDTETGSVIHIN